MKKNKAKKEVKAGKKNLKAELKADNKKSQVSEAATASKKGGAVLVEAPDAAQKSKGLEQLVVLGKEKGLVFNIFWGFLPHR